MQLDWLNKFVEYMWPYLNKAICKTARTIAKPIIAEQIPKYKIDSVEFEELNLGSLPPTFQGSIFTLNFCVYLVLHSVCFVLFVLVSFNFACNVFVKKPQKCLVSLDTVLFVARLVIF